MTTPILFQKPPVSSPLQMSPGMPASPSETLTDMATPTQIITFLAGKNSGNVCAPGITCGIPREEFNNFLNGPIESIGLSERDLKSEEALYSKVLRDLDRYDAYDLSIGNFSPYDEIAKKNDDEIRQFFLQKQKGNSQTYLEIFSDHLRNKAYCLYIHNLKNELGKLEESDLKQLFDNQGSALTGRNHPNITVIDALLKIDGGLQTITDSTIYQLSTNRGKYLSENDLSKLSALVNTSSNNGPEILRNGIRLVQRACIFEGLIGVSNLIGGNSSNLFMTSFDDLHDKLAQGNTLQNTMRGLTKAQQALMSAQNKTIETIQSIYTKEEAAVRRLCPTTPAPLIVASVTEASTPTPFPTPAADTTSGPRMGRRLFVSAGAAVAGTLLAGFLLRSGGNPETEVKPGQGTVAVAPGDGVGVNNTAVIDEIIKLNQDLITLSKNGKDYGETERSLVQEAQKNLNTAKGKEIMAGLWNQAGAENQSAVEDLKTKLGKLPDQLKDLQKGFADIVQAHYRAKISTVMAKDKDFGEDYQKTVKDLESTYMMNGLSDAEDRLAFLATYPADKLKEFHGKRVTLHEEESGFRSLKPEQQTMLTEVLDLKSKKYTDKEDIDQVAKAYSDHGQKHKINNASDVTRGKLVEMAKADPQALSSFYVELLDADCRVQAKEELAELLKINDISIDSASMSYKLVGNREARNDAFVPLFKSLQSNIYALNLQNELFSETEMSVDDNRLKIKSLKSFFGDLNNVQHNSQIVFFLVLRNQELPPSYLNKYEQERLQLTAKFVLDRLMNKYIILKQSKFNNMNLTSIRLIMNTFNQILARSKIMLDLVTIRKESFEQFN